MTTNWKAGDKAVCVDDTNLCADPRMMVGAPITRDTTYIVREFLPAGSMCGHLKYRIDNLLLCGVVGATIAGLEVGFQARRFRKVVTRSEREAIEQEATL